MRLSTDAKVIIGVSFVTLLILFAGVYFLSKENQRLEKPLLGQEVKILGRDHLPEGSKIDYNSNPPAGGPHYPITAHAGIFEKAPADGYLVHSLEHGAVILWYDDKLEAKEVEKLKNIFNQTSGKGIMTPRKNMDVPVALTSWGRVLKLKTIDEKQIKAFFETNIDRGLENAPI